MDSGQGCFERFWMTMAAVVMAAAVIAGVVVLNTNRVTAQEADYSQFVNGYLYLITPVGEVDRYTILETPHVKDGFLCAMVDQYNVEMCAPLTNVAGMLKPS
jgi:hypothetical protein